jgi:hypothetical protein
MPSDSSFSLDTIELDDLLSGYEEGYCDAEYEEEYPAFRIHVPRPLVWGFFALASVLVIAASVWGWSDSSTAPGDDWRVDLSECVAPIRATLVAADAPWRALYDLEIAAQPGMWASEAHYRLLDAGNALESASDNPAIALARQKLQIISKGYGCDIQSWKGFGSFATAIPLPLPATPAP